MTTMQIAPSLDNVKLNFKTRRMTRTRGTMIPEELWQAGVKPITRSMFTSFKVIVVVFPSPQLIGFNSILVKTGNLFYYSLIRHS